MGADTTSADFSLVSAWIDGPVSSGPVAVVPQVSNNISDLLLSRTQNASDGETARVFVNLADSLKLPLFPPLPAGVGRIDPVAEAIASQRQSLVDDLTASRLNSVFAFVEKVSTLGITPTETFWLVNGFTADVPLELVSGLAADPEVVFIQLDQGEAVLPQAQPTGQNGTAGDKLRIVRDLLNTDPYDNLGLNGVISG